MASTSIPVQASRAATSARSMRVGLVDEYPSQVAGAAAAFDDSATFTVVMTAASGEDARLQLHDCPVDVMMIEPWMRSGDGISSMSGFRDDQPGMVVIALSRMWDPQHVAEGVAAGASGHIPKTAAVSDLPALVRQVMAGISLRPASNGVDQHRHPLTRRERDVLRLAAVGMPNAGIAAELYVTEQTVKFHLSNVYRKLGAHNRTEAAHHAARTGMLG